MSSQDGVVVVAGSQPAACLPDLTNPPNVEASNTNTNTNSATEAVPALPGPLETSSSRIINDSTIFRDTTRAFIQAASALRNGTLVKDEPFSLFEAVGALEIGDPKMDSGYLEEGESMQAEYDCTRLLSPGEVVWLMDELLCHEVAWLTGYPLSQTLFTSSYIDCLLWPDPGSLNDAIFAKSSVVSEADGLLHQVFRSYCLALIKSCDLVHTKVIHQQYYEEEDFASHLFNRELLHRFDIQDVQALLKESLVWLEATTYDDPLKIALTQRMLCRQQILRLLWRNNDLDRAQQLQVYAPNELLNSLKSSVALGVPVPESFSLKIQRTLASGVPPRPMVKVEYTHAIDYFENLFNDSCKVFEVFDADGSADIMTAYWLFMTRKPQPSVYIRAFLQSFLEHDDKVFGRYCDKTFIFDDLQRLVLPASPLLQRSNDQVEVPSDKRFQISKQLDFFVSKTRGSFGNLFRTACLNRCRVRRTLCHALIEWDHLQAEAEDLDEVIRCITDEHPRSYPVGAPLTYSYPLSSWVYHHKLCQMESLVQIGFELSIYAPEELPAMYWYLAHLCSIHLSHLDRISFFVEKLAATNSRSIVTSLRALPQSNPTTEESLRFLLRIFTRLKATEALATSLHLLYTLLARRGWLSNSKRPYASDRLRHELRMRPFLQLSIPDPPVFEEVETATSLSQMTDREVLDEAQRSATLAKAAWEDVLKQTWNFQPTMSQTTENLKNSNHSAAASIEEQWKGDSRSVVKACIGVSISIVMLKRKLGADTSDEVLNSSTGKQVELPKDGNRDYYHKFWLVPRIVA